MTWTKDSKNIRNTWVALLILSTLPGLVWAQSNKKSTSSPPPPKAAPAKPAAAPPRAAPPAAAAARPAAPPARTNSVPAGRTNTTPGGNTNGANAANGSRTNATIPNRTNTPNTANGARTNIPNTKTNPPNTANGIRTNTPNGAKPNAPNSANLKTNTPNSNIGKNNPSATKSNAPAVKSVPTRTVTTKTGSKLEYSGSHLSAVTTPRGTVGRVNAQGRVSSIHTANGTTIERGPRGERRVVTERADHTRIVSYGRGGGYVQHPYIRNGHEYARRTYVYGGRTYTRVYRTYYYRGVGYYHYVPAYYYAPRFYGWAYAPWGPSIAYGWGWGGAPWYGYYGYYFAPAPFYPSAAFWLTDYVIAANLQAAYENQQQNAPPAPGETQGAAVITPEMKQLIADEVQRQLAAERDSASGAAPAPAAGDGGEVPPPALDPQQSMFVVSANLDVPVGSDSCSLTSGDLIERLDDSPGDDNAVEVRVLSSKPKDCQAGARPRVQVADLQEMGNDFREKIDQGLGSLAENQGKNGLPAGPAGNPTAVAEAKAPADLSAVNDLKAQQSEADQAEQDVQQSAGSGQGGGR
jgi:hypothetical protein